MKMERVEIYKEIFKSLASEKRLKILLALAEGKKSFTELMRTSGCKSSGELAFHIDKLEGLIEKNRDGKYRLTELGARFMATLEELENIVNPDLEIQELPTQPKAVACAAAATIVMALNWLLAFQAIGIEEGEAALIIALSGNLSHILLLTLYRFRYTLVKRYPYLINLPALGIVLGSPDFSARARGILLRKIFNVNLYVTLYLQLLFALVLALILTQASETIAGILITAASLSIIPLIILYYRRIYRDIRERRGLET